MGDLRRRWRRYREDAGRTAWKKRYDQKYPGQFQVYSPFTYDATFVLVDAIKRANSSDPRVYVPKLAQGQIQFDKNGELKNPAVTLNTYRDGKRTALDSMVDQASSR